MRLNVFYFLPVFCLTACAGPAFNHTPQYSVSTEYVSEYVFRGTTLAGEAIQPNIEASVGNFTAGVWGSAAVGEESNSFADEVDIYANYSHSINEKVGLDVGATLYHYPQDGGLFDIGANDAGTVEVYGGLSFDTVLAPSVTAYYDTNLEAATLEGGVSHALPINEKTSFEVSAQAGLVEVNSASTDYQYGSLRGQFSYNVTENASLFTSANYGVSSENTFVDTSFTPGDPTTISNPKKSGLWFTMGVSSSF